MQRIEAGKPNLNEQAHEDLTLSEKEQIYTDYICPISQSFMNLPLLASDGHHYEASEILEWTSREEKNISPLTSQALTREYFFNEKMYLEIQKILGKKGDLEEAKKELVSLLNKYTFIAPYNITNIEQQKPIPAPTLDNGIDLQNVIVPADQMRNEAEQNSEVNDSDHHYKLRYIFYMGFFMALIHYGWDPDLQNHGNAKEPVTIDKYFYPAVPLAMMCGAILTAFTACVKASPGPFLACTTLGLLNATLSAFTPLPSGLEPFVSTPATMGATAAINQLRKWLSRHGLFSTAESTDEENQSIFAPPGRRI